MTRMVFHTGEFLNQGCNARERPQVGLVTTADRTGHEGLDRHLRPALGERGEHHHRELRLDAAQFAEVAKEAEGRCPVSNAYRGTMTITVEAHVK